MTKAQLTTLYQAYIACLNQRDWPALVNFVDEDVAHNGRGFGLAGYRKLLEQNLSDIPDLAFVVDLLVVDPPYVASRLRFDCTPHDWFLDLEIGGRRITFCEDVFYEFRASKIWRVWSIIDRAAIEAQLR